jgi:hypothetical protein
MYNDFVLIGPKADPAGTKGKDIVEALKKLAAPTRSFISRGDKSGTHAAELRYWKMAGRRADAAKGSGYKECGCGMGPALNMRHQHRRLCAGRPGHLAELQEPRRPGGAGRRRQAAVQPVRRDAGQPGQAPACQSGGAQKFVDWVVSPPARPRLPATRLVASSCSSRTPSPGWSLSRGAMPPVRANSFRMSNFKRRARTWPCAGSGWAGHANAPHRGGQRSGMGGSPAVGSRGPN